MSTGGTTQEESLTSVNQTVRGFLFSKTQKVGQIVGQLIFLTFLMSILSLQIKNN